jgi:hypothetical protein
MNELLTEAELAILAVGMVVTWKVEVDDDEAEREEGDDDMERFFLFEERLFVLYSS